MSRSREAQRRPVHLEAEVFDLMTKWIERYRREAEERYRRLDAVLAEMNEDDETPSDPRKEPHHEHHHRPRPPSRPTRPCRSSASPATSRPPRAAVPGAHRSRALRAVDRPDPTRPRIDHWDAAPAGQLALRRHPRRRGVRLPRLLPRGRPGPHRADLHLGGHARRRRAGDADLRGPRRRPHPAARPVAVRQLRGPRRVAEQRHGPGSTRATPSSTGCSPMAPSDGRSHRGPGRPAPLGRRRLHRPGPRDRRLGRPGAGRRVDRPRRGRHLVEWFPGFLAPGGVRLPAGPSVDDDPVAAWQAPGDAVQARARRPGDRRPGSPNPHIGELPLAEAIDRFYTADVFMHTWDLARATGQDDRLDPDFCAELLAGMEPIEDLLRPPASTAPGSTVPDDADVQTGCSASSAATRGRQSVRSARSGDLLSSRRTATACPPVPITSAR